MVLYTGANLKIIPHKKKILFTLSISTFSPFSTDIGIVKAFVDILTLIGSSCSNLPKSTWTNTPMNKWIINVIILECYTDNYYKRKLCNFHLAQILYIKLPMRFLQSYRQSFASVEHSSMSSQCILSGATAYPYGQTQR